MPYLHHTAKAVLSILFGLCSASALADQSGALGPCNASTVGSTDSKNISSYTTATCTGVNCFGKRVSISYHSTDEVRQAFYRCTFEYPNKYDWYPFCEVGHKTSRSCRPVARLCPTCLGKENHYATTPNVVVDGDKHWDTCAGRLSANPGGDALRLAVENADREVRRLIAAESASYEGQLAALATRNSDAEPLLACTADPVDAVN